MTNRKGIVLAGGSGTRLHPLTKVISKQLMPIYDKPMIFFPISVLMLAGIREIAVITTPHDQPLFERLLLDGSQWGLEFTYLQQPEPEGLAQAYLIAEDFLDGKASAMILGDNIFFGHGLSSFLEEANKLKRGGTIFGYQVSDPERYGVLGYDQNDSVTSIVEKPERPASNYAVTGLYFLDEDAPRRAKKIVPSARGELEIVSLLDSYLADGVLSVQKFGRGFAWLDTGTHSSLLDAGNFVKTVSERQGIQVGCLEEIAFENGWIDAKQVRKQAKELIKTEYGRYLKTLINHK